MAPKLANLVRKHTNKQQPSDTASTSSKASSPNAGSPAGSPFGSMRKKADDIPIGAQKLISDARQLSRAKNASEKDRLEAIDKYQKAVRVIVTPLKHNVSVVAARINNEQGEVAALSRQYDLAEVAFSDALLSLDALSRGISDATETITAVRGLASVLHTQTQIPTVKEDKPLLYQIAYAACVQWKRLITVMETLKGEESNEVLGPLISLGQNAIHIQRFDVSKQCFERNIAIKKKLNLPTESVEKALGQVNTKLHQINSKSEATRARFQNQWQLDDVCLDETAARHQIEVDMWRVRVGLYGLFVNGQAVMLVGGSGEGNEGSPLRSISSGGGGGGSLSSLSAQEAVDLFSKFAEGGQSAVRAKVLGDAELNLTKAVEIADQFPNEIPPNERRSAYGQLAYVYCMRAQAEEQKGSKAYKRLMAQSVPLYRKVIEMLEQKHASPTQMKSPNKKQIAGEELSCAATCTQLGVVACNLDRHETGLFYLRKSKALKVKNKTEAATEEKHIQSVEKLITKRDGELMRQACEKSDARTASVKLSSSSLSSAKKLVAEGRDLIQKKQFQDAEQVLLQSVVQFEKITKMKPEIAKEEGEYRQALTSLATCYYCMGQAHEKGSPSYMEYNELSLPYYSQALQLLQQTVGANDPMCTPTLFNLGCVYVNLERFEMAMRFFSKCRAIKVKAEQDVKSIDSNLSALKKKLISLIDVDEFALSRKASLNLLERQSSAYTLSQSFSGLMSPTRMLRSPSIDARSPPSLNASPIRSGSIGMSPLPPALALSTSEADHLSTSPPPIQRVDSSSSSSFQPVSSLVVAKPPEPDATAEAETPPQEEVVPQKDKNGIDPRMIQFVRNMKTKSEALLEEHLTIAKEEVVKDEQNAMVALYEAMENVVREDCMTMEAEAHLELFGQLHEKRLSSEEHEGRQQILFNEAVSVRLQSIEEPCSRQQIELDQWESIFSGAAGDGGLLAPFIETEYDISARTNLFVVEAETFNTIERAALEEEESTIHRASLTQEETTSFLTTVLHPFQQFHLILQEAAARMAIADTQHKVEGLCELEEPHARFLLVVAVELEERWMLKCGEEQEQLQQDERSSAHSVQQMESCELEILQLLEKEDLQRQHLVVTEAQQRMAEEDTIAQHQLQAVEEPSSRALVETVEAMATVELQAQFTAEGSTCINNTLLLNDLLPFVETSFRATLVGAPEAVTFNNLQREVANVTALFKLQLEEQDDRQEHVEKEALAAAAMLADATSNQHQVQLAAIADEETVARHVDVNSMESTCYTKDLLEPFARLVIDDEECVALRSLFTEAFYSLRCFTHVEAPAGREFLVLWSDHHAVPLTKMIHASVLQLSAIESDELASRVGVLQEEETDRATTLSELEVQGQLVAAELNELMQRNNLENQRLDDLVNMLQAEYFQTTQNVVVLDNEVMRRVKITVEEQPFERLVTIEEPFGRVSVFQTAFEELATFSTPLAKRSVELQETNLRHRALEEEAMDFVTLRASHCLTTINNHATTLMVQEFLCNTAEPTLRNMVTACEEDHAKAHLSAPLDLLHKLFQLQLEEAMTRENDLLQVEAQLIEALLSEANSGEGVVMLRAIEHNESMARQQSIVNAEEQQRLIDIVEVNSRVAVVHEEQTAFSAELFTARHESLLRHHHYIGSPHGLCGLLDILDTNAVSIHTCFVKECHALAALESGELQHRMKDLVLAQDVEVHRLRAKWEDDGGLLMVQLHQDQARLALEVELYFQEVVHPLQQLELSGVQFEASLAANIMMEHDVEYRRLQRQYLLDEEIARRAIITDRLEIAETDLVVELFDDRHDMIMEEAAERDASFSSLKESVWTNAVQGIWNAVQQSTALVLSCSEGWNRQALDVEAMCSALNPTYQEELLEREALIRTTIVEGDWWMVFVPSTERALIEAEEETVRRCELHCVLEPFSIDDPSSSILLGMLGEHQLTIDEVSARLDILKEEMNHLHFCLYGAIFQEVEAFGQSMYVEECAARAQVEKQMVYEHFLYFQCHVIMPQFLERAEIIQRLQKIYKRERSQWHNLMIDFDDGVADVKQEDSNQYPILAQRKAILQTRYAAEKDMTAIGSELFSQLQSPVYPVPGGGGGKNFLGAPNTLTPGGGSSANDSGSSNGLEDLLSPSSKLIAKRLRNQQQPLTPNAKNSPNGFQDHSFSGTTGRLPTLREAAFANAQNAEVLTAAPARRKAHKHLMAIAEADELKIEEALAARAVDPLANAEKGDTVDDSEAIANEQTSPTASVEDGVTTTDTQRHHLRQLPPITLRSAEVAIVADSCREERVTSQESARKPSARPPSSGPSSLRSTVLEHRRQQQISHLETHERFQRHTIVENAELGLRDFYATLLLELFTETMEALEEETMETVAEEVMLSMEKATMMALM